MQQQPTTTTHVPLADRLRPQTLDKIVGQTQLLGADGTIRSYIAAGHLPSLILWGPPGCGKTTLARLLAQEFDFKFIALSAVFSGVADLKSVFAMAQHDKEEGRDTLLFVDEIHRFNKAQQDGFLPYVENGTVVLVGATTENPSFALNAALLSRCQVLVFNRLDEEALESLLQEAEDSTKQKLPLTAEARAELIRLADGDGRYILNLVEQLLYQKPAEPLGKEALLALVSQRALLFDKSGDQHYNLISALHKSMRGSDADAALYWFARMLAAGEDPRYIARRLVRFATEDVGLAHPYALTHALDAWQTYERLGSPEGELALANCVVYLATAHKSNAVYSAFKQAQKAARSTGSLAPPKHILNAPTQMMKDLDYGKGYEYDHDAPAGFSGQNYFPDNMRRPTFYKPEGKGQEADIKKRLTEWQQKRRDKK